jgi:membrane-associated phospholipid phosphatase
MQNTTNPGGQGIQMPTPTTTAGGENRQDAQRRHRVEAVLWIIGLLVLTASCFVIHAHPQPYSFDLAATHAVQGWHLPAWLLTLIVLPSIVNDPIFSETALGAWVAVLLLISLVRRLRKLPALSWLMAGIFLAVTVSASAGLNVLLDEVVGRPRPNPKMYHFQLHTPLVPFPTYPSGHVEHDVAYYGFLLYLSFTKSVREWRFRWILIPFQIYAVFDLLDIGLSRIYEGDHWFTDVLGGYLEGAVYLFFFIFLYRLVTNWIARRHQRKMGGRYAPAR